MVGRFLLRPIEIATYLSQLPSLTSPALYCVCHPGSCCTLYTISMNDIHHYSEEGFLSSQITRMVSYYGTGIKDMFIVFPVARDREDLNDKVISR